jgi:RimJ/RimL family protein N-acetyltransferase
VAEFALETERLILTEWQDSDVMALTAICRDPKVMEYIGPLQNEAEVRDAVNTQRNYQDERGYCYWAMRAKANGALLGFCGMQPGTVGVPKPGLPDIGWRLASAHWGLGYATEAATASLNWGFENIKSDRIWAITVPGNQRSWALMERIGMMRHHDMDFDHPRVPDGSPLKRHITYSIDREMWLTHR